MRALAAGLLSLALAGQTLAAGRCGDDDAGRRVPCDCGDVLVSSRTLGDDDPITTRVCPATGLVIDVPAGHQATLALGGRNLRGAGRGFGIQLVGGGAGVSIVGPGAVQGFGTGILATKGGIARVANVTAAQNTADGISIVGEGYAVSGCEALRNGRDGFALRGRSYRAEGNRALENRRDGVAASGRDAIIGGPAGNEASGNGHDGFRLHGRGHTVDAPSATANRGHGVATRVTVGQLTGTNATANQHGDVRARGTSGCEGASCR